MSCSATKVVSSMSSPAWFAKVKIGKACKIHLSFKTKLLWRQKFSNRTKVVLVHNNHIWIRPECKIAMHVKQNSWQYLFNLHYMHEQLTRNMRIIIYFVGSTHFPAHYKYDKICPDIIILNRLQYLQVIHTSNCVVKIDHMPYYERISFVK